MKIKAIILIIVGSVLWSLTMVKSGVVYDYGIGFWGPNGHDGIWHISLANSLAQGTWEMPVFAGEQIQNYHVGFDLLLVILHKLTFIPITNLYFQILPPVFALLIGYFAYKFVFEWTKSEVKAWWSTFFIYFGGSWGWLVSLLRDGSWGGESMFWAQQSISTLINPPFALSLVVLFAALWIVNLETNPLQLPLEKGERDSFTPPFEGGDGGGYLFSVKKFIIKKRLLLVSILFGILIQIKVYAGLLALTGLFVAGFWRLLRRKGAVLIKVFLGAFLVSLFIFSPTSGGVGGAVEFRPFWFLEAMMSFSDRLGWQRYAEAMINYKLGGVWLKGILAYAAAFLIFWFGNLGIRIIKEPLIFKWIKNFKTLDSIQVFLLTVIAAGIIVPTFFVQTGTPWNTIQFMYYSLVFSGIVAGIATGEFLENTQNHSDYRWYDILIYHTKCYVIPFAIVILTIPTTFATLGYHYLPSRPPAKISISELEALQFLEQQPDGVVLTQPFNPKKAEEAISNPPRPLYAYETTAYVSAMSGKKVYLEDEVNLEITGYDWRTRRESVEKYFFDLTEDFLKENNIDFIYIVKDLGKPNLDKENIFENNEVVIYDVQ